MNGYYDGICNKCGNYVRVCSSKYGLPRCTKCNPVTIQEPKVETDLKTWLCKVTNEEWIKVRPKWLPSPSCDNYYLELDMYCKKLKLAVEYNGPHHFIENVGIYGLSKKNVLKIINHDKVKQKVCKKKGINLLVINGIENSTFLQARKETKKWLKSLSIL